jgi:hypothetical protein
MLSARGWDKRHLLEFKLFLQSELGNKVEPEEGSKGRKINSEVENVEKIKKGSSINDVTVTKRKLLLTPFIKDVRTNIFLAQITV